MLTIDLAKVLITHPQATYFLRARGHSMVETGIFDNDILVVDRAIKPRHGHIVVAIVDGDFTVKLLHQRAGRIKLKAANPTTVEPLILLVSKAQANSFTIESVAWLGSP